MGWQDIYKKKMQESGLAAGDINFVDVDTFHKREKERWASEVATGSVQTVTAPAKQEKEKYVASPYGTFLGGFSYKGNTRRQKTEQELADEAAQQAAYIKEYQRLAGLDLDSYGKQVESAKKAAQKNRTQYNVRAFGGYDANRTTDEERTYAAMQADYNKAKDIQYDIKGQEALESLTAEQSKAVETLATERSDTAKRQTAWTALQKTGLSDDEISQLVNYQRNIPKRQKNAERYAEMQDAAEAYAETNPGLATIASVPANLLSGIGTFDAAMRKLSDPDSPVDYKSGAFLPYAYSRGVRDTVTKNLESDYGKGASFAYGVGTSILDSAATVGLAALGIPAGVASATLGGAAATSAMTEAKARGLSDEKAILTGVLSGVAETALEKFSLESLISMKLPTGTAKQRVMGALKNAAVQAGIEGSEEMFTDFANLIFDAAVNGSMSDVQQRIAVYMAGGMDYDEARKKVLGETVKDVALDFVAGGLAGGLMGGGNMALQTAAQGAYESRVNDARMAVRQRAGVTGSYQAAEDGKTSYNGQETSVRSVVKDGKVELTTGETVDPKDVQFSDRNTADLYEGAIRTAENAGAAQVFVDSYTGGDVSTYILGMQEAYHNGKEGVPLEDAGGFAADLSDAQRKAAWEQGRAAASVPDLKDYGFGEKGTQAWNKVQENEAVRNNRRLRAGFTAMYQAGMRGESASAVKSDAAKYIPPSVQTAAYQAGLADAAESLARETAAVQFVSSAGSESGLVDNEYARKLAEEKSGTAALLSMLGKDLGVRVEIVPKVLGGNANGQYVAGRNLVQIAADADDAFEFVAAHEVTHRMQSLAPEEYRSYRDYAMRFRAQELGEEGAVALVERYRSMSEEAGVTLTQEEAMDEIAANFTMRMIEDGGLFEDFARENRSEAGKLLDALKAFIAKVKALFRGKEARDKAAREAYGTDMATLEECVARWQKAYTAAGKQAQRVRVSDAVQQGDTLQYDDAVYSLRVTDKDTLDFLNGQKTIKTYKTMQIVDGKLYPPMAARVDGKYEDASELGKWEMAVERPDLVKDGKFKLDKGKGQGSLTAAYNPYMHSSNLVINDQFSGAYTRNNLVTVECEVPVSEMTSGYHAEGAKDGVGWHSWHTGTVAGQIRRASGTERKVFLSRWIKPVRILPDAEVAGMYKDLLGDTGIAVPDNVVTPSLLKELRKVGVAISESGRVNAKTAAGDGSGEGRYQIKKIDGRLMTVIDTQNDTRDFKAAEAYLKTLVNTDHPFSTILMDAQPVYVGKDLPGEYRSSEYTKSMLSKLRDVKMQAATNLDEMLLLAENGEWRENVKPKHAKDAQNGWYRYDAEFAVPILNAKKAVDHYTVYGGTLLIRNDADGKSYLYDLLDIEKKKVISAASFSAETHSEVLPPKPSTNSISTSDGNVNAKFSLKGMDSAGRQLSEQQQEYFKDSKVRDAEGRLKPVYHGSDALFTKFSADFMSKNGSSEGQGFYFTDLKTMAQGYEKKGGQLLEGYLDIKNPLSDSKVTLTSAEVKRLIKAIDPTGDDLVLNYDSRGGMGYPSKAWYERAVNDTLRMTMESSESDSEILAELANGMGNPGAVLKAAREVLGYDGYIVEGKYDNATVYVAFDSSQFKNMDNLTPTSDPDIRFSLKGMDSAYMTAVERGEAVREVGVSVDEDTSSASPGRFSLKTWNESDYVKKRKEASEELSRALGVSVRTAKKYIDNINSVAKMIADDRVRLDYEASPGRSSFVSNSEYGGSLDFSTICKKRRLLTGTLEAIQRALPNTALTADEILSIRRMMADKGYEVSCGLCYVEGSRAKMGVYTKEFLEEYAKSGAEYVPNMAEMNTATGQERIRSEHPEVYEAYEKYMNKLAQRKPKLYQLATEYQGEIRKKFKGKGSVEEKNKNGGMRLQSFSDFEIIHLIDCMQAIMDMSEVGLAGQAYTKVPDFAWALGDTGLKINLSLIAKGVDANGNIILDETEGMTRSDAEALRKRYPKNVGTILVVFNDAQLRAAMKNDFIDFIIPFHRSQWNSAQYEALGLPQGAKDYTPWQNESYIEPVYNKTGKKQRPENYMPNEYWDYGRSGKENAEKYLRMCSENNRKPKFSFLLDKGADGAYHLKADGSTDGYWKLLIDFKMYDNVGNGSPQMPVSPKFNMEECERMLRDYTGGHAAFPVANDVVDQFVETYKESNPGVRFQLKSARELEQEVRELKKYAAYRKRGTSDREILASTADGSAQTEWERKRLSEYKDVMGRLETYERRLSENKAKLEELSFMGEKKNAKRISQLKTEITQDTNRISIVENKLGELENTSSLKTLLDREKAVIHQQEGEYLRKVEELMGGYRDLYGTMAKGEKAARDIQMPKKTSENEKISQTVRTILEAKATPDEMVPTIEEMALNGEYSYEAYSDKNAISDAEEEIKRVGWAQSLSEWTNAVQKGEVSKKNTAMGWALYNNAANSGDTDTALTILSNMVEHQRSAAQALQATRILKSLSPETQLYQAQRSVDNLQTEMNKRYGDKKAPELKIDPALAEQFMQATDQETRDAVLRNIYRDIGKQMPSRFVDKWNAWRYLAMLGNARTHVRNVVGNAGFAPVVAAKNAVATGIEKAVYRLSDGKMERSKEFVFGKDGKALLKAAAQDYAKVQDVAMGGGKYSDLANANKYIEEGRVIFQSKVPGLKQVSKGLEAARKANSKALDAEDAWFSKPHYAYAMAQYCKANGITPQMIESGKGIEKAREYAIREAQKATYRDTNSFSQAISELGRTVKPGSNGTRKAVAVAMEGILPFRKTPANILVRGVEYSPIGLMNGIKQALFDVRNGTKTAAEAIDSISAGLTGTGLLGLGLFLAAQGLVRGHGSDDDDKNAYAELTGHQAYALELPDGTSITLDWLAPECLPFFIGVNLWEITDGGEEILTMSDALNAVTMVSEPLLEMSCLQSLNDVFDAVGYAKNNGISALPAALANAATSYITQALPTILGQAERAGESIRYATYTDKNSVLTSDMQYAIGRASAKIPGLDYSQIPYIDAWGRRESTGNLGKRLLNNFLNPAYVSDVSESEMEKELLRLYEATGESGVLPRRAGKSFSANKETINLTGEQYVKYAEKRGGEAYKWMTALTQNNAYRSMSDEEKADCVKYIYEAANEVAKSGIVGSSYEMKTWVKDAVGGAGVVETAIAKTKYADVSKEAVNAYKAFSGSIGEDVFLKTWDALGDITGEDYDGDGRSDAYSKIDKKLEYINGLNLTAQQKRALAIANGINEKTVDKRAPW